jgi:hypothetical protein
MGGMKYRKLRIAWSVAWGIAALLLIALWVTSYSRGFAYDGPLGQKHCLVLYSKYGQFAIWIPINGGPGPVKPLFIMAPDDTYKITSMMGQALEPQTFGIPDADTVVCAYWIPTLLASVIGVAPWVRWPNRFSLRTLLIATTLVAVVLGLIVYRLRTKPVPQPPSTPAIQPGESDNLFGAMPPRQKIIS